MVPEKQPPCHGYLYGIDVTRFETWSASEQENFVIDAIHQMMTHVCDADGLDQKKIDDVTGMIKIQGANLEIMRLEQPFGDGYLQVKYTVDSTCKLFARVTSALSDRSVQIHIIDLDELSDAFNLAAKLTLSKSHFRIYPRRSEVGSALIKRYGERLNSLGFLAKSGNCMEIALAVFNT